MILGFVADRFHFASVGTSHWIEGAPEHSFWTSIKKLEPALPIGTYKCRACGFLESYSSAEYKMK
jgi:hypothetical protein